MQAPLESGRDRSRPADGENRLKEVEPIFPQAGDKKLQFAYDYLSRRVRKQVYNWNGNAWVEQADLRFVYDEWNVVLDANASGGVVRRYTWGLDLSGLTGRPGTEGLHGAGGIGGLVAAEVECRGKGNRDGGDGNVSKPHSCILRASEERRSDGRAVSLRGSEARFRIPTAARFAQQLRTVIGRGAGRPAWDFDDVTGHA